MIPGIGGQLFVPTVHAQSTAPVGAGFTINADDLRFIFHAIEIAQEHSVTRTASDQCGTLLGPGPNAVNSFGNANPQLPLGLRTVDGSCNNLVPIPDQHLFGASDQVFPRRTTPVFRAAEGGTSYTQTFGDVIDSQPRIITNLIVDQSRANPAAVAAATNPCGSGGFVCSPPDPVPGNPDPLASVTDPDSGALFIPNITPDFGLSAPFNLMFTFFGQFFDHGLDLVNKGGNGNVIMPLQPDDPLFVAGRPNFMVMTRATMLPGPDGIVGTADDIHDSINQTTPWVDQNQTYTSHPAHQVFLREYGMRNVAPAGQPARLRPFQTGKVLDGGFCAPRGTGIPGDQICNIGNWANVKAQASTKLGIRLTDQDIFDVPLVLTDPYGHFIPGPNGFAQLVIGPAATPTLREGDPTANGGLGVNSSDALHTNHQFLNDVAHNAVPAPGLVPDGDTTICDFRTCVQPAGTYDDELLNLHMVTGDGRGNENIALTMVHQLFHAEHNRLRDDIDRRINTLLTPAEIAAWHAVHAGSGWDYGERLFQAARFATEMQYQHLVFEEFARKVQPLINPFLGGITSINGAISAEFAHTVYRLGHSMLPEVIARINADGSLNNIRLLNAFLAPQKYNDGGPAGPLTADKAAGAIIRGLTRQIGNELDEFVTASVRNTLVGLPLDLPAINIARGRSEGIPPLNEVRRQLFAATKDAALEPYPNWFEFGLQLKHPESLINFVAAYGTAPACPIPAGTVADRRNAASALVAANGACMFAPAATSGLNNVDFWPGGMAEKQSVFGGLLGTTFNYIFETQLEFLQNGDRFYYLQRLDGLNLVSMLESNSLAELARRNTNMGASMDVIFNTADEMIEGAALTGTDPVILDPLDPNSARIFTLVDGTKMFFDPLHRGQNIVFNGTAAADRFRSDVGDDSIFGNGGNDRLAGGEGNDTLLGGDGDDILFGDNGDDVLKGGPGNDAMQSGPGFGGDLMLGGDGNDFMVGSDDGNEFFGGPGNDFVVDGAQRAEAIVGGEGDDWIDAGDGHDGGMFGDDPNVFDLVAGLNVTGGDDVEDGGPGQDNAFGHGGDDIYLMSEGSNKFFGDYGFDWITLRGWAQPEFIELSLLALPNAPVNFNDLRNKYRFVDGASGWDLNDHIAGSNSVLCEPPGEVAECLNPGMELRAGTPPVATPAIGVAGQVNFNGGSGAAKIAGLTALMAAFGADLNAPAIPGVKDVGFMGGDLLLGGRGSDILEGKLGDDLIDGDVWLDVRLRAVFNDGSVREVNGPRDLVNDVLSDPQRLNPGNISIVRRIITPPAVPADCGAAVPLNCDTAVYNFPRADFDITPNANGTVTVTHVPALARDIPFAEGTDTLRNIEQLQFTDMTIPTPVFVATALVPNVVGLTEEAATAAITAVGLLVGDVAGVETLTVPVGTVLGQSPAGGTRLTLGGRVNLEVAIAPRAVVPSVIGLTQAVATASITGAGLVVGTVTTQSSAIFPAGTIISQDPVGGNKVPVGTAVNLVVSTGPPPTIAATVTRNSSAQASTITSPLIAAAANTLLVAFVSTDAPDPCCAPNTVVNSVTNTNGAMTWTKAVRSNGQLGTAEVWWAFTPVARSGMLVTARLNNGVAASITVMAFTNAASSLVGAAAVAANAASGAPSATLITTRPDSYVIGVGVDWDAPRVMTPAAGQTIVNQFNPTVGDTYWVQRTNPVPGAGTSVTISDTYPGAMTDRWNLALIEIRKP
jgi:Ca2+-binding RTX toxin-like protein